MLTLKALGNKTNVVFLFFYFVILRFSKKKEKIVQTKMAAVVTLDVREKWSQK